MITTPIPLNVAITVAALDIYTAYTGTPASAAVISLDLTNTTSADITVDLWKRNAADSASYYVADDLVVPAKGTASWRGILPFTVSGEKLRGSASATGVDLTGSVMEFSAGSYLTLTFGVAANISQIDIGDAAAAGAIGTIADAGHQHAFPGATPAIVLGSAAAAGAATTPIRSDATIAAFDTTAPTSIDFGDAAAVGSAAFAARRDHQHAFWADGQIPFPATQNPSAGANTLDDYEEGTWTPTIAGATTAGSQTYTNQVGEYTKVGRAVHIMCYVKISAKDGATAGTIEVRGLPFNMDANSNPGFSPAAGICDDVALDAGFTQYGWRGNGTTKLQLREQGSAAAGAEVNSSGMGNSGGFALCGTYDV